MRRILFYFLTACMVMPLFNSCSGEEEEKKPEHVETVLTVDNTSFDVDALASTVSFIVSSNKDWKAELSGDWVTLSITTGTADSKMNVTATITANAETTNRDATITIKTDDKTSLIKISQKGKEVISGIAIADEQFKKFLVDNFDVNKDGEISTEEAEAVKEMDCSEKNIKSLDGIENFVNLESLNCNSNELTKLVINRNVLLTSLSCETNNIDSLDLSTNTALQSVDCSKNELVFLNLGNNTKLETLVCADNELATVNVSDNTGLKTIDCSNNRINNLNIDDNKLLTALNCSGNGLDSLNVSNNTNLTTLDCTDNATLTKVFLAKEQTIENFSYNSEITNPEYPTEPQKYINIPDEKFKAYLVENFDADHNGEISEDEALAVKNINCFGRDISSIAGIEHFKNLDSLSCRKNKIVTFDISKNLALKRLVCDANSLISLDVSKNTELEELYCFGCQLNTLDVSNNMKLKYLLCYNNNLSSLDLTNNTELELLYCQNNKLSSLNLKHNMKMKSLNCKSNSGLTAVYLERGTTLTEANLDAAVKLVYYDYINIKYEDFLKYLLSNFDADSDGKISTVEADAVKTINCSYKNISSLEGIANFPNLTSLTCSGNALTSLDLSSNKNLQVLVCDSNNITTLNLSNNPNLIKLDCQKNGMTSLNVTQNTKLTTLICNNNALSYVDIMNNLLLETFLVHNNNINIMYLDLKRHSALKTLDCRNNKKISRIYLKEGHNIDDFHVDDAEKVIKFETTVPVGIAIPDVNFKKYLVENFDKNKDGEISEDEAAVITEINCYQLNISSLEGIEYCKNLITLQCQTNNISSLPLESLTRLRTLNCSNNNISSLNLIRNTALQTLNCMNNNLSVLSVRNNPSLKSVRCDENPNLENLYVTASQLSSLAILTDDVANVVGPSASSYSFSDRNFENYLLENFDKNNDGGITPDETAAIIQIDCSNRNISSLSGIEHFTNLYSLNCSYNNISSLSLNLTGLGVLYCNDNKLTSLDVSGCTVLEWLVCAGNLLKNLDLGSNAFISLIDCSENPNLKKVYLKTGISTDHVTKDSTTEIEFK